MNGSIMLKNVVVDNSSWCREPPQRPIEVQMEFDIARGTKVLVTQSAVCFAVPLAVLVVVFFVNGGTHMNSPGKWVPTLIAFGVCVLCFLLTLIYACNYIKYQRCFVISSQVIVTQGLWLWRNHIKSIPLEHIRNISVCQNVFERFFEDSSLLIELHPIGNIREVHLRSVIDALRVQEVLMAKTRYPSMIPNLRTILEVDSIKSEHTTKSERMSIANKSERVLSGAFARGGAETGPRKDSVK